MSNIFDKWNKQIDGKALAKDVKEVEKNGGKGGDFPEIPHGTYEVKVDRIELKESKASKNPMVAIRFKILAGQFKGQTIFMNQVVTQGFQIHIVNDLLRSMDTGLDIEFDGNYNNYNDLLMDVHEAVDGKLEFVLEYDENDKGYNTFKITEVFEVE